MDQSGIDRSVNLLSQPQCFHCRKFRRAKMRSLTVLKASGTRQLGTQLPFAHFAFIGKAVCMLSLTKAGKASWAKRLCGQSHQMSPMAQIVEITDPEDQRLTLYKARSQRDCTAYDLQVRSLAEDALSSCIGGACSSARACFLFFLTYNVCVKAWFAPA